MSPCPVVGCTTQITNTFSQFRHQFATSAIAILLENILVSFSLLTCSHFRRKASNSFSSCLVSPTWILIHNRSMLLSSNPSVEVLLPETVYDKPKNLRTQLSLPTSLVYSSMQWTANMRLQNHISDSLHSKWCRIHLLQILCIQQPQFIISTPVWPIQHCPHLLYLAFLCLGCSPHSVHTLISV